MKIIRPMSVTDAQFSRASTATYYDTSNVLQTAAVDNARVNSNITYTQATPAVTNLFLYSEQLDNAIWGDKAPSVITPNVSIAPDGTMTATSIVRSDASPTWCDFGQRMSVGVGGNVGKTYTFSIWLWVPTGTATCSLCISDAFYNTRSGSNITVNTTPTRYTFTSSGGSGWNASGSVIGGGIRVPLSTTIYMWGGQFELSPSTSTYIKSVRYNGTIPATFTASTNYAALLYETASTNLLTYSEQFNSAAWNKFNTTITSNSISAPDGNTTADTLTASATASAKYIFQNYTASATTYTMSVYAKTGNVNWLGLCLDGNSAVVQGAFFDLSAGVLGTVKSGTTASMKNLGNGWYRCSITRTMPSAVSSALIEIHTADNQSPTAWTANGDEYLYIWGAQIEQSSSLSSYIQTVASTVTRAADVVGNSSGTFVSSNITENDYPAYSASTVYATGTYVKYVSGDTHKIYQSLSGSTATFTVTIASPAVFTATAHGLAANMPISFTTTGALPTGLVAGTVYYVLAPTTNTFKVSATAGGSAINTSGTQSGVHTYTASLNYNQPVTNTTYWLSVGNTNKWKAFDQSITSQSSNTDTIQNVFKTTGRIDSIALLNISGASVNIKQIDATDGLVYDKTYSLISTSGVTDWYAYFFEPIVRTVDFVVTDLLPYANSTIVVTITDTSNTVLLGGLVLGLSKDISYLNNQNVPVGVELGMKLGIQDYSVKTQDTFGNYTILQRAFRKNASMTIFIDSADVDTVANILAGYRAIPTVYVGSSSYGSSIIYGFYKDFSIDVNYHLKSVCTITLEGLT